MNWTLPRILEDVAQAWSPENLPYTVGFWLLVGIGGWLLTRSKSGDKTDDA